MIDFIAFFKIGLAHILDLEGIDHLLFIASILLAYTLADWRVVIKLLTAFTLGHALSMVLGYYGHIPLGRNMIEFLIPLTILGTSMYHLAIGKGSTIIHYVMICFFGLIHGAAYSGEFMSMMGRTPQVLLPLLGFNIGVEFGQILFGTILLLTLHMVFKYLPHWKRTLTILIFGLITLVALYLAIKTWPW